MVGRAAAFHFHRSPPRRPAPWKTWTKEAKSLLGLSLQRSPLGHGLKVPGVRGSRIYLNPAQSWGWGVKDGKGRDPCHLLCRPAALRLSPSARRKAKPGVSSGTLAPKPSQPRAPESPQLFASILSQGRASHRTPQGPPIQTQPSFACRGWPNSVSCCKRSPPCTPAWG